MSTLISRPHIPLSVVTAFTLLAAKQQLVTLLTPARGGGGRLHQCSIVRATLTQTKLIPITILAVTK